MDVKKTHVAKEVLGSNKTGFRTTEVKNTDSVNISSEAKLLAEVGFYKKIILNKVPDVRMDRVNEAREKLASGYYTSDKVLDAVSRNLSKFLDQEEL